MDIVTPEIDRYLDRLAQIDDPVLNEMERLAAERGFPIVGPQVGRLLELLARSIGARRVLELGSGFGYSACWFARAVGADGEVLLTEGSEERTREAAGFLERAGFGDRVRIETGDALEIASKLEGPFDILFNDIDKHDYPRVPEQAARLLRPGGLFITDNMLWSGEVLDNGATEDSTRGVRGLTESLLQSDRFRSAWVPVRDGLSISIFEG